MENRDRSLKDIRLLLVLVILILMGVHLVLPTLAVDGTTLGLVVILVLVMLLPYVKSISLPGGGGVDFLIPPEAVVAVAIAETELGISEAEPPSEAEPQPVWRTMLDESPNIALAGLRIEIERRLQELASRKTKDVRRPISELLPFLFENKMLTIPEWTAFRSVLDICNRAVHAQKISREEAQVAADLGDRVLRMLDNKLNSGLGRAMIESEEATSRSQNESSP